MCIAGGKISCEGGENICLRGAARVHNAPVLLIFRIPQHPLVCFSIPNNFHLLAAKQTLDAGRIRGRSHHRHFGRGAHVPSFDRLQRIKHGALVRAPTIRACPLTQRKQPPPRRQCRGLSFLLALEMIIHVHAQLLLLTVLKAARARGALQLAPEIEPVQALCRCALCPWRTNLRRWNACCPCAHSRVRRLRCRNACYSSPRARLRRLHLLHRLRLAARRC
mmetsp:Transcript_50456/g.116467  ORF Transcript_50456/g.116467 Transcript_50456/m.116467 type:complete len:221 (-) Transcript_50456:1149-1811(-)